MANLIRGLLMITIGILDLVVIGPPVVMGMLVVGLLVLGGMFVGLYLNE